MKTPIHKLVDENTLALMRNLKETLRGPKKMPKRFKVKRKEVVA